ncbi:MAG: metalloregulator ArsR/SmtB family transcription factor [Peptoniphilus sp.]|uniref:ArsR/SmtB family transcription factor n=1 Tax=Peptoniphilus sp. TaxID=1971214 RepID=UPI002A760BBE|nr:metalloregulator ArsR/SmtB family transcription factor [Peptoniphilus sp.]MDY2986738.1 metalloregulator ArsR/SmtB family transcription factor [Peptoniphilus sp.]
MKSYVENSKVFKAFCDPKRLAILDMLKQGEKCACVLLEKLDLTQSGLSYHMKILTEAGVVIGRQDGKWTYYNLSEEGIETASRILLKMIDKAI